MPRALWGSRYPHLRQLRGPFCGSFPSLKGSEVWALRFYRVFEGIIKGTHLRAHTTGPCNLDVNPEHCQGKVKQWERAIQILSSMPTAMVTRTVVSHPAAINEVMVRSSPYKNTLSPQRTLHLCYSHTVVIQQNE